MRKQLRRTSVSSVFFNIHSNVKITQRNYHRPLSNYSIEEERKFFDTPETSDRTLWVINQGYIQNKLLGMAKPLGFNTVAICPKAAPYQGEYANEIFICENMMDIEEIKAIFKKNKHLFKGNHYWHPGFGFWSEIPEFGVAAAEVNAIPISASPETIRAWGHKGNAQQIAKSLGVPIIPGGFLPRYIKKNELETHINKIMKDNNLTYPVMVKDPLGGAGRGNRKAENIEEVKLYYHQFTECVIEQFMPITECEHIEIAVLITASGPLFFAKRFCSAQRDGQKFNEISCDNATFAELIPVAEEIFSAVKKLAMHAYEQGYRGLGTYEFLYHKPTKKFHFMEKNTRLQVEQYISDLVSGVDGIVMQLLVALELPVTPYLKYRAKVNNKIVSNTDTDSNIMAILNGARYKVATQARFYAENNQVYEGDLIRNVVTGKIDEVLIPKHIEGAALDCYWKPGMTIDTSRVDPLGAIGFSVANSIPEAQRGLLALTRQFSIKGQGISTNRELMDFWLQDYDHAKSSIGHFQKNILPEYIKHLIEQQQRLAEQQQLAELKLRYESRDPEDYGSFSATF